MATKELKKGVLALKLRNFCFNNNYGKWMEQDHDLPSLYHNFIIQFDKRVTPKEARLQLSNFKASTSSSLAKLE